MSNAAKPARPKLGRGLGALLSVPSSTPAPTPAPSAEEGPYLLANVELIDPMPGQPRQHFDPDRLRELSESIRHSGVLQPLIVRRAPEGRFSLIAGERRLRASMLAGLGQVPVIVREDTDADTFVLALVENIQRADLNPVEEALAYQRLLTEYDFTHEALAKQVGRSRSTITNALRVLRLPTPVIAMVAEGELSAGHARAILSAPEDEQALLAERILTEDLSVRDAEALARDLSVPQDAAPARPARKATASASASASNHDADAHEAAAASDADNASADLDPDALDQSADPAHALSVALGFPVVIKRRGRGLQVQIDLASDAALGVLVARLQGL